MFMDLIMNNLSQKYPTKGKLQTMEKDEMVGRKEPILLLANIFCFIGLKTKIVKQRLNIQQFLFYSIP